MIKPPAPVSCRRLAIPGEFTAKLKLLWNGMTLDGVKEILRPLVCPGWRRIGRANEDENELSENVSSLT